MEFKEDEEIDQKTRLHDMKLENDASNEEELKNGKFDMYNEVMKNWLINKDSNIKVEVKKEVIKKEVIEAALTFSKEDILSPGVNDKKDLPSAIDFSFSPYENFF